ncbi:MAG: OPT/YSL family transporter [Phycisphaeraceae bacterium]|nr:OPT/YSL family transporter [Phycisphaeraceae bacterium]
MAMKQLSDEQIRDWSLEQKDRWWLENVFRGNMPQLTIRSALMGFMLGGILSATNLYVGAKTGWSLGVGITSVILSFAFFRVLQRTGLAKEFTILENNCVQSIATSAGYMTAPLISSLVAYMIVSEHIIPWWQMMAWNIVVSILGVLFAFPMKRRFINDEQHPFPEGRACGVVLDALHSAEASSGMVKARILVVTAAIAAFLKFIQAHAIQEWIQHRLMKLKSDVITFPEQLGDLIAAGWTKVFGAAPSIGGVDLRQLTLNPTLEFALIGAGGLMGIKAGMSLLIGGLINYAILAPIMINMGEIPPARIIAETGASVYNFRTITTWALWPGVACMVFASFTALFAKPQAFIAAFSALTGKKKAGNDVLRHIELPLWISIVGVPIISIIAAFMAQYFFGVKWWVCLVGLPLAFILALVAASSTALTGTTPVGATSKVTQLFYGIVDKGNIQTNLATASLTAEVVSNASNLLMDIKPGYMLGAKPRQQAIGHVIGIIAGSVASVPLFFILFVRGNKAVDTSTAETTAATIANIQSDAFPMPAATIWKAVAEALTQGIGSLPVSVLWAAIVGSIVGLTLELGRIFSKGKFPLSPVALGLAFVISFEYIFAMSLGAIIFWFLGVGRKPKDPNAPKSIWVENHEPICAGVIAGAALMGILDAVIAAFVLN